MFKKLIEAMTPKQKELIGLGLRLLENDMLEINSDPNEIAYVVMLYKAIAI